METCIVLDVRPDDDDGAETGGGPPPDPSVRSWRHPSEIAAAAAAANRPIRPDGAITTLLSRFAIIGAIATAAVLAALTIGTAVALRTDAGPTTDVASQAVANRAAVVPPAPQASQANDLRGDTESTIGGDGTADSPDLSATEALGSDDASTTTRPQPVDGAVPPPDLTDQEAALLAEDQAARSAALAEYGDGVYGYSNDEIVRLASFMVVDGMFLTSASAIGDQRELTLLAGDAAASATVVGVDDITDVAVLTVPAGEVAGILSAVPLTWTSPDPAAVSPGVEIRIGPDSDRDAAGVTIGSVQRTAVNDGSAVFDVILTTASRPEGASGSAVVDLGGAPIGMVIDTPGYLARIMPLEAVVSVGQSFLEWGSPAAEWLGIEGFSHESGGVEIRSVDSDSPAGRSGVLVGDVIVTLDDQDVADWHHLVHLIRLAEAGNQAEIGVVRDGTRISLAVVIGSRPDIIAD